MRKRQALLIIDMQKGCFTAERPGFDMDGVVNRINDLARRFREAGFPVIFIQHDGTAGDAFIPDTYEWELLPELEVENEDIIIRKYANDSFYCSRLGAKLKELDVGELCITGFATDFCVEATIQSALAKDYNITVVRNGHTTGDREHMNAEKVIEHYNWVWQNMLPTKGSVKVADNEKILTAAA